MSDSNPLTHIEEEAMRKTVYLDRQIVIDYMQGDVSVINSINLMKASGFIFPYSPAHIEEISKSFCLGNITDIDAQIYDLDKISDGVAIMPNPTEAAEIRPEDIHECLARVKDDGGRELTEYAAKLDAKTLKSFKNEFSKDERKWELTHKRIQKLSYDMVFSDFELHQFLEGLAIKNGFRLHTATFSQRQNTIYTLYNALDIFGFMAEVNESRSENRMHDLSHAIYASYADFFISNDRKLRNKSKAIFMFLNLCTTSLSKDEFIEMNSSSCEALREEKSS